MKLMFFKIFFRMLIFLTVKISKKSVGTQVQFTVTFFPLVEFGNLFSALNCP